MKTADSRNNGTNWSEVTAKALSYLCLHVAELRDEDQGSQADFYLKLGIARDDVAEILGVTANHLSVVLRRVQGRRTGGKHGSKNTKSR